jgi:hypothetical protein
MGITATDFVFNGWWKNLSIGEIDGAGFPEQ